SVNAWRLLCRNPSLTILDVICYSNDDCEIVNTHCSRFQFCACNKNYITIDRKVCTPILEAYCTIDATYTIDNSVCVDNTCQCSQGFVPGLYNDCVPCKNKIHFDNFKLTVNFICIDA
ncbi:GSCOCG00006055001-RA-CDS, partial [Cotesia congregata]